MPKVIKKRPAKKKPVQQDNVRSAALEALDKLKERQKHVIMAVIAVVAVVLIYVIIAMYFSSTRNKAYSLEKEAYTYYYGENVEASLTDEERWKKALELYKQSVDVKATPTALYYLGNCYYNIKDYDNAITIYKRFTDTFSSDKRILPLVYQKLASAFFKTNQNDKALEITDKLGKLDKGIFRDTALVLEARYYESAGEKEKSIERYKAIINDFPVSAWSAEAGSKVTAEEGEKGKAEGDKAAHEGGDNQGKDEKGEAPAKAPAAD